MPSNNFLRSLRAAFLCMAVVWLGTAVAAVQQPVQSPTTASSTASEKIPPPLKYYKGREIAQTMHYLGAPWLTRESRDREEDCKTMLKALKVKPGDVICDMGCGNGFYSLKLARLVGPKGKILAVDIQPEMLHLLKERGKSAGITNIKPILGSVVDPNLGLKSCDMVLCVDVYHEFSNPVEMLAAIRKSLKPDGRLVLAEFRAEDPNVPIKPLHKMTSEQVLKELEPNGFKMVEDFERLPWQHLFFFKVDANYSPAAR